MSISIRIMGSGLAVALAFSLPSCGRPAPQRPRRSPGPACRGVPPVPTTAARLLRAHNLERAARGLSPFRQNARLNAAAQAHAEQMAAVGRTAHDGIGDGNLFERLSADGYWCFGAAENVATAGDDASAALLQWLDAPDARAVILGTYSEFGGGHARGAGDQSYWCVVLGRGLAD